MKLEIFPEDLIWEYVGKLLRREALRPLTHQKHFPYLPAKIDLSEGFLEKWRKVVSGKVQQFVARHFAFRPLLFLRNDTVLRLHPGETDFWREISLEFSHRAVRRIWEDIIQKPATPAWQSVTPADALFLSILQPALFDQYTYEWLAAAHAPWLVTAVFLRCRTTGNRFPWTCLLTAPQDVPLPLRELLIERSAWFFRQAAEALRQFLRDNPAGSVAADPQAAFSFTRLGEVAELIFSDAFGIKRFRAAFSAWTSSAVLGLDDERYLHGAASQFRVFEHIAELEALCGEIHQVMQSGSPRPETQPAQPVSEPV
jgi:hypothetical protein